MNEKWMEEIKRHNEMMMLNQYFPGESCGNTACEKQCIEFCRIAERMGRTNKNEITSEVAKLLVGPENCPALKSSQNQVPCRFQILPNNWIIACDNQKGRRIIGKKYICDADASSSGACKKCLKYANRIFKWPEDADKMPKLPLHPNCKCRYEDVYESHISSVSISSRDPENLIMPNMTPSQWDNLSKLDKKSWCMLFKTKFGYYISEYSKKIMFPKSY